MSGLYEELGIPKDASQDQIRKAYKKRALQTHPDRLTPGATPAEKAASEEKFRKVNNAYEVLSDPQKRSQYDIHGVWPLPEEDEFLSSAHMPSGSHYRSFPHNRHPSRSHTFPDPFFSHHHHAPFSSFQFTDPFTLFNSIFEGTPFQNSSSRHRHPSYPHPTDPFDRMNRMQADIEGYMNDIDRDPFGFGGGFPRFGFMPPMPAFPALNSSPVENNHGHWVSESYMTSTVNGVTQTIRKRVDSSGNEHITRTLPDGREVRTINGVEQPPSGYNSYPSPSKNRRLQESSAHRYLPPDTPHSQPMASTSRMNYGASQPPPYAPRPTAYQDAPRKCSPFACFFLLFNSVLHKIAPTDGHRRRRSSAEKYYTSPSNPAQHSHEERPRKKKWWQ
ncbi:hypothetical protein GALMADRAFT_153046 [Galerina marginata CBS 339.88]|uniref:J domain-containing protein n=1 Tax=Galerina marginata (strain CBS 339.88) TaxID=685588 RepID=A0A067TNN7_GALM3|nr:hypothetical protein GALMADRAFT_153046 [Galerina marginata CBS 339.88]